jgi:ATP-dependent helicase/nuclease subunit B
VLLVVPGEAQVRYARQNGKHATTRDAFYASLFAALCPGWSLASPLVVRLAVSETLHELSEREPGLERYQARGGNAWEELVTSVVTSIAEAHRMGWLPVAEVERLKLDWRARLVAAVMDLLERRWTQASLAHPAQREGRIAQALPSAVPDSLRALLGDDSVLLTGVHDLWPADLALWRALDARLSFLGKTARVELPTFDRPFDASRSPDPLGQQIDAVAEAMDDAPETRPIAPVLGDFTFEGELPAQFRDRVEVRRADGRVAGARAVLEVVRRSISKGTNPEDVAIVLPDPRSEASRSGWGPSIVRVLDDAGLPVHSTLPHGISSGPSRRDEGLSGLLAFALEALSVAERGLRRLELAPLLRSHYVDAPMLTGLKGERDARDALDRLADILERTPTAAGETPQASVVQTVLSCERGEASELQRTASLAARVAEPFASYLRSGTARDVAADARRLLRCLGVAPRPSKELRAHLASNGAPTGTTRAELLAFARDLRDLDWLEATLLEHERAFELLGTTRASSRPSLQLTLRRELAARRRESEANAAGAVRVCTLGELTGRPLTLLVFADAHEGALTPSLEEGGMLDAAARKVLLERMDPALRAAATHLRGGETCRLAVAAEQAARIVFVYATYDLDARVALPHRLVDWLVRQGVRSTACRDKVVVAEPLTEHEARLALLSSDPASADRLCPEARARAAVEAAREQSFGLPAASLPAPFRDGVGASVRDILTAETGGADRALPVLALDRFGTCLFQGFAADVLRARKTDVLREIVEPREEGTLLHQALAAAFDATKELWSARPRDPVRIRALAESAAESVLLRGAVASRLRRAAMRQILSSVTRVLAWSLADEDWDFQKAEARLLVVLDDHKRRVRVRGSADRIDVAHGGAALRVVDYKRGEEGARRLTSELGETSFQLAVYASGASEALGVPATAGIYLPTRRLAPSYAPRDATDAFRRAHTMEDGVWRYVRRALDLVTSVREGVVTARPANPESCRTCDFDGVCRKPRFVIASDLEDSQEEVKDRD